MDCRQLPARQFNKQKSDIDVSNILLANSHLGFLDGSQKLSNCAVPKLTNKTMHKLAISNHFGSLYDDGVVATVVLVLSSGDIFGGQGSAKSWPVLDTK